MNSPEYENDRRFSNAALPGMIQFVQSAFFETVVRVATDAEDMGRATDLVVENGRRRFLVAVRSRRAKENLRYERDVTVRASRPSRVRTELHKIDGEYSGGEYQYMAYGFSDGDTGGLVKAVLLDLAVLVPLLKLAKQEFGSIPWPEKLNDDGTTFLALPVAELAEYARTNNVGKLVLKEFENTDARRWSEFGWTPKQWDAIRAYNDGCWAIPRERRPMNILLQPGTDGHRWKPDWMPPRLPL